MPTNCKSFRASALFTRLRGAKWHADELQEFSRLSFVHTPTRREMACRRTARVFAPQLCSHAYEARNGMPTNCNSFRASSSVFAVVTTDTFMPRALSTFM